MNPCTADKTRITLKNTDNVQYNIKNVCYTPIASENKGYLQVFPENLQFNIHGDYSLFGDFTDLDGNPVTGELNTICAVKLPDYTDELYLSHYYVHLGDKTSYFKDGTGDYTVTAEFINASDTLGEQVLVTATLVKKGGEAQTSSATVTSAMRFSAECVFKNYTPSVGDILFVTAFLPDKTVLNSGFSLVVD